MSTCQSYFNMYVAMCKAGTHRCMSGTKLVNGKSVYGYSGKEKLRTAKYMLFCNEDIIMVSGNVSLSRLFYWML